MQGKVPFMVKSMVVSKKNTAVDMYPEVNKTAPVWSQKALFSLFFK